MAEFPALPLWTDAFLSDTMHLDATETGAYLLLLMIAWRRPNNDLPDDDVQLRRFARVSAKEWRTIKPTVMAFWYRAPDGNWHQKKLDGVRDETKKRSKKAQYAASVRHTKPLKAQGLVHADATPEQAPSTSNHNHNHNHNQEIQKNFFPPGGGDDGWPADYRDVFWRLYPHKIGKPKALAKLDGCRKRGVGWPELIEGLRKYISKKPIEQAWCNPETWINQQRWNDEPDYGQANQNRNRSGTASAKDQWDDIGRRVQAGFDRQAGEDLDGIIPSE